jgi:4-amino-4-deoxy-L-arabinose transferase-like glycosyltransferase
MKTPPAEPIHTRINVVALVILTLAFALFIVRAYSSFVPSYYGLADEHGYLTTAKRLATTGHFVQHQSDPYAFIGETMMQSPPDPTAYYLRQPPGYPVLLAIAYYFGGPQLPFAVNDLLGLVLILGVYLLGKELSTPVLGAIAALVIAAHTLVLHYTIEPLSHILDMTLAVWTIYAAVWWRREGRLWQAVIVGVLVGLSILTRYLSVLIILPLLLLFLERRREMPLRRWAGHLILAAAVVLLLLIPLLAYQAIAFGSMMKTGYSAGDNATSFSLRWLWEHAPAMGAILISPQFGFSTLLLATAAGIVMLAKHDRPQLWMLLAWGVPPLLLYTAYYGKPTSNMLLYARFALTSFVPLVLLSVVWVAKAGRHIKAAMIFLVMTAGVAVSLNFFNPSMNETYGPKRDDRVYAYSAATIVRQNAPANSLIICDNFTYYFIDYIGDYVVYNPELFYGRKLQNRLADLDHHPHEFDPVRTLQLKTLLGGRDDAALDAVLRNQLIAHAKAGGDVYLLTMDLTLQKWMERLGMPSHYVDGNSLGIRLLKLDPLTTNNAPQ